MSQEELKASELLLDLGVSIPLRPLRFFDFKKEPRKVVIRRPYLGGLIRMSQQFLKIGVTTDEMKKYGIDEKLAFVARYGKAISRIAAGGIARGYFSYKLSGQLVAWWLRWRVHPIFLFEMMSQLMQNADIRPFYHIIKLVEVNNLMKPRLSHSENNGS